jgi:hypothetical protein
MRSVYYKYIKALYLPINILMEERLSTFCIYRVHVMKSAYTNLVFINSNLYIYGFILPTPFKIAFFGNMSFRILTCYSRGILLNCLKKVITIRRRI